MKVLILGAGVIGTSTAWYLTEQGHEVVVVERQKGPGLETSFANGGQISVSHSEPWANPDAPAKLLKWLPRDDAPLLFRLRMDPAQWSWGLKFLYECQPWRTRANSRAMVMLSAYSRDALHALRGLGLEMEVKSPSDCVAIEPALAPFQSRIAGATFTRDDESGDAHKFSVGLTRLAREKGARFLFENTVQGVRMAGGRVTGAVVKNAAGAEETLTADAYVVALGSYSPLLTRPIGLDLPIYPTKGYSATVDIVDESKAPTVSITDDEWKMVFTRLGRRMRIAGTAELSGYSTDLNPVRCQALTRRAMEIFPGAAEFGKATFWTGLRPSTPSNVPLIGPTKIPNLYLNTGHGTLGWTMACGSGRAQADIISGRKPEIPFPFTS